MSFKSGFESRERERERERESQFNTHIVKQRQITLNCRETSSVRLKFHLARLDLLDWLDKVERVESSRAKWNLSLTNTV